MLLKAVGIEMDTVGLLEAIKTGDPVEIVIASLRLAVSVFSLSCHCFTGDTLVSTEDGDRRIDEIEVGDYVWAYNTETGERELKEVLTVPVTRTDIIVHITLSDGEEIETTMFHPFYVQNEEDAEDTEHKEYEQTGRKTEAETGRWVVASNLVSGDVLLMEDGQTVYVERIQVEKLEEEINVYNLEVDEWHTYFVSGGVLVHNKCTDSGSESGSSDYGNYKFKDGIDVDLRGKGNYRDALNDAFKKTGVPKEDFRVTKLGRDKMVNLFQLNGERIMVRRLALI